MGALRVIRRKELDDGLEQLKGMLIEMGTRVEEVLGDAMRALENLDTLAARRIIADDIKLNQIEENVDLLGARMIATQQPVAKDLRRILVAFKMASDLERMGDLAVDIAKVVVRLDGQTLVKPLDRPAPDGRNFAADDSGIDPVLCAGEREFGLQDGKGRRPGRCLVQPGDPRSYGLMMDNPRTITQAGLISFVGRYIERIADHATNIGESVVYLVTGQRPDLNA